MDTNMTLCVGTLYHEINDMECLISRILGSLIAQVSIFAIIFNIRFLYWSTYHPNARSRHYPLIISMIISSLSVIIVISPSVFVQCFYCYRWCSPFYCRFEGFVSYLNGCVNMFMLMMISIIRYSSVIQINIKKRWFEQHSSLTVIICWLCGLVFALPPLFHWNEYIPEGIGFHCGLNWFDRSIHSIIYFIITFSFVYFIPLLILIVINIYVYYIIRRLLSVAVTKPNLQMLLNVSEQKQQSTLCTSSSSDTSTTINSERLDSRVSANSVNGSSRSVLRRTGESLQTSQLTRVNRLKADRRFALATTFLISEYLLSWTPYAIVALFYLFNVEFISQQSIIMTICAFTAKTSMILNPFIYIATIKTDQLKTMLFCKKCSCPSCRMKRNIII
ncbi:unnamed protein product [Adineta steineri]|uniref:G-protein coupled receptors family 1 profile domain-containing protein n=1 Tax=Adineta steineri TaxID=433720 RepID=A0A813VPX7_9BILA|nr:unnamed protein product [Adineta steineri]CAF0849051.1 unnamed protein product [Adineta steineri]